MRGVVHSMGIGWHHPSGGFPSELLIETRGRTTAKGIECWVCECLTFIECLCDAVCLFPRDIFEQLQRFQPSSFSRLVELRLLEATKIAVVSGDRSDWCVESGGKSRGNAS